MGVRLQRSKEEKKFRFIKIIIWILAILLFITSILAWVIKFSKNDYLELIISTQLIFFIVILLYLSVTSSDMRLYIAIIKSFTKLFFNVWVVMFILISISNQVIQNLWTIYISMCLGYFEVMLELDEIIKEEIINSFTTSIKFLKNEEFTKLTKPINIIVICVIHLIISFILNPAFVENLNVSVLVN
jgi:hypothetical protein